MGSQQPCHNCSHLLPVNENDDAHSKECASTTGDLQEALRTCQVLRTLHLLQDYVCLCLQPPADLTTSKAGSVPHTGSPVSTQAAGAPSCATGLASHHIHTCMWPWGTTCLFHSLLMSRNNNAHSLEHATTTGDTQEVPRAHQALHKPRLPFHCLSHVIHMNCRAPSRLGGTTVCNTAAVVYQVHN